MNKIIIRNAQISDVSAIAKLSLQMGHEISVKESENRLDNILNDQTQVLLVAEVDERVLGYNSVSANYELLNGVQARIEGLVVDESARGLGLGRKLMEEAEDWARSKGSKTMKLGSNAERMEAHKFYEKIGYVRYKDQAIFKKEL